MSSGGMYIPACKASFRLLSGIIKKGSIVEYSKKYASKELISAIGFTGLSLEAEEVFSFALLVSLLSFVAVLSLGAVAFLANLLDNTTLALVVICSGIVPMLVFVYVSEYPKRKVAYTRIHSLGDVPEIVSYIVMSMKLNPNMERSLAFAVCNSKRQLSKDVRKLMWDMQMRAYDSMDEALTTFANNWGSFSEHFKRSVFLIKSSTAERDEAMRTISLNRALDVVLAGTKALMRAFSSTLHSPTLILYSIFVMVPLALVAMLPAASVVGFRVNVIQMVLLYDVLFPLVTIVYAHSILMKRPAAFSPPEIPDDHPLVSLVPRWAWAVVAMLAGAAVASSYVLIPDDILPVPKTILLLWGATAAISIYCWGVYGPYKKIRDDIVAMESEFADSLFVLGRRVSEGRSPEEAFAYTAHMVHGSAIGRAYRKASFNIRCLRTTLRDAVLNEEYGAFSDVYSDRIRATISMLVETSSKSGDIAGTSVIKLADHLKELQSIEDEIRKMLYTMTSMLKTTCIAFAPFIGGVTLALSMAVTSILMKTLSELNNIPDFQVPYISIIPKMSAPTISSGEFVLIVGVYILLLVLILLRFVGGIEYGDDRYEFMYSIGKTLPVSIAVFTITTALSGVVFSEFVVV
jgi:hypothetical protein